MTAIFEQMFKKKVKPDTTCCDCDGELNEDGYCVGCEGCDNCGDIIGIDDKREGDGFCECCIIEEMFSEAQFTTDDYTLCFDEFINEFKDDINYSKFTEQITGQIGGTCQLENSILYKKRENDKTITNLQFRHFILNRPKDNKNINHFTLVYLQNGKMYMESRANFIHKKIHFGKWCRMNTIVSTELFEPYQISVE